MKRLYVFKSQPLQKIFHIFLLFFSLTGCTGLLHMPRLLFAGSTDTTAPGLITSLNVTLNSSILVTASWNAASEPESEIESYEYCISSATACGGTLHTDWTSVGTATNFSASGFRIGDTSTYYISIRSTNSAGLTSLVYSEAQTVALDWSDTSQLAYLKASNTTAGDAFGTNMALYENTLIVGAPNTATGGAVYIFKDPDSDGDWSDAVQQNIIQGSNTAAGDAFGFSLAIYGSVIVVGAYHEDGSGTGTNPASDELAADAVAIYIFVDPNSDGDWSDIVEHAYVKANNSQSLDEYGYAVAIYQNTIVVGARNEAGSGFGTNPVVDELAPTAGAVYILVNPNGDNTWSDVTQQVYLKPSNTGSVDTFGNAVAIYGSTIVVGAVGENGAGTGINPASDEGAANSGAAYIFVDPNGDGTWTDTVEDAYVKASNTENTDTFGHSVDIYESTIVISAFREDSIATGVNGNQASNAAPSSGAAYVFIDPNGDGRWNDAVQQAYLKSSNTPTNTDGFGASVAIHESTIVVGSTGEDGSGTGINPANDNLAGDAGAIYIYVDPNGDGDWTDARVDVYGKAANSQAADFFGNHVDVFGLSIVTGAPVEAGSGTGVNPASDEGAAASGAIYLFTNN